MLIATGDTLVALAVVIGADIKALVGISLVPDNVAIRVAQIRFVGAGRWTEDRTEHPAAGDNGMRFQQFE